MTDSRKTKAELLAALEAMQARLAILEDRPGQEKRSNYLLRIFIDALPNFAFAFDRDGQILRVITGNQNSEARVLEGRLLAHVLPREDAEAFKIALARTFDTSEEQQFDFVLSVLAGRKWYQIKSSLVREPDQKEDCAVFLFHDITNEKLAEGVLAYTRMELEEHRAARLKSETRFRSLMEGSIQGILVQRNQKPLYVNDAFARMFGFESSGEVLQLENLSHLINPDGLARQTDYRTNRMKGEPAPAEYQAKGVKKDGSVIWLNNFVTVANWDDSPALMVTCVDITEHKAMEERLRQAQKMEAVGQLAGGIAHEFNNILHVIMGLNGLVMDSTSTTDERYQYLERMSRTSGRGAALVKQLLGFSRQQLLKLSAVNLNEAISNLSRVMNATLGEQIQLQLELAPAVTEIHADQGAVDQMLLNLSINGRDAMPSGGVLTLRTKVVELDREFCLRHTWAKPGAYVCASVSDTGDGMPEEVMAHIFEPFFTTKGPQSGSGLGLAMVDGLMEQHHGLINVTTNLGTGSIFELYFPAFSGPIPETGTEEQTLAQFPKGEGKILVAEDENEVRFLTTNILESMGYTVIEARDGDEAVRNFQANDPGVDLVLLDVVMPRMGGIDAYRKIRNKNPDVPVIFQTGYQLHKLDAEFLNQEGLRILNKPYSTAQLRQVISELLDDRH